MRYLLLVKLMHVSNQIVAEVGVLRFGPRIFTHFSVVDDLC